MKRIYTYLAARLVRAIVAWCTARKRYVDYVHTEPTFDPAHPERGGYIVSAMRRVYMRRYVLFGFMTGDPVQTGWRAYLPNLYLHHMHAPDADECLHDHPWPWGLSLVLLGGYREQRAARWVPGGAKYEFPGALEPAHARTHNAPAFNWIPGRAFHRVAKLDHGPPRPYKWRAPWDHEGGTWTLFLAGPRRRNKAWGYLVPGRGYVNQKERHAELGASEVRPSA